MNNSQTLNCNIDRRQEVIEQIMKLHRCADCPIRCQAVKKPHSLFARIHRWHRTWWPGWKIKWQSFAQETLEDLHVKEVTAWIHRFRRIRGSKSKIPMQAS